MALSDLNDRKLYVPTPRSQTSLPIPHPKDEMDWLAQVPEDGQTFDDFISFLTTRTTGRIRPIANPDGQDILLLPIVRGCDKSSKKTTTGCSDSVGCWPDNAPPLSKLVDYTQAFFDRRVHVLSSAQLHLSQTSSEISFTSNNKKDGRRRKKQKVGGLESVGAFASSTTKGKFKLSFPRIDEGLDPPIPIAGRADYHSGRCQLQVTSLLNELSAFRHNRLASAADSSRKDFCIMGLTMEDLYDGPKDLFCAGMAFGGDKVAVFSFARYHPFLKMSPLHWHQYGYADSCDGYSYYENDEEEPVGLTQEVRNVSDGRVQSRKNEYEVEFLRRSSKLLTHELGHLYGLDHCVHNRCLMMGTGHLVEDFNAPSHLCGICLRKMQWRLGFNIKGRYKMLAQAFKESMGMKEEGEWCNKQYNFLNKK